MTRKSLEQMMLNHELGQDHDDEDCTDMFANPMLIETMVEVLS